MPDQTTVTMHPKIVIQVKTLGRRLTGAERPTMNESMRALLSDYNRLRKLESQITYSATAKGLAALDETPAPVTE